MAAASSDGGPTGGRGPPTVLEFLVINFSVCLLFLSNCYIGLIIVNVNLVLGFFLLSQILIRTASFLNKFTASENSLCMLFANNARRQLHNIFIKFGDNIKTVRQLRNAVLSKFFDLS